MSLNTLKTTAGYIKSLIGRHTPFSGSASSLDDIYNYLPIDARVCTSGQRTEKQLSLIKSAGFEHLINLAPHNAENALTNEAQLLADLGIEYTHIPVDFQNPTDQDFDEFVNAMSRLADYPVWIHCAANMRVSAFMFRYRCGVLGETPEIASKDLHRIWKPFGAWKGFLKSVA